MSWGITQVLQVEKLGYKVFREATCYILHFQSANHYY